MPRLPNLGPGEPRWRAMSTSSTGGSSPRSACPTALSLPSTNPGTHRRYSPEASSRLNAQTGCTSPAIRAGNDLHQVTIGVREVDAASAVIVVDLPPPLPAGIGPVRAPALGDPAEDDVEVFLADQERIVLGSDVAVGLGEVEGHAVVRSDDEEMAEPRRGGQAQYLGQETC